MLKIPKIIHQVWEGKREPLPEVLARLGETWRELHPDWEYICWDAKRMEAFIQEHYPEYWNLYNELPYNVQRWDVFRYMLLYKIGGMYVDFDYECLSSMEEVLDNKNCCLGLEPAGHVTFSGKKILIGNALMASTPLHPFMYKLLEHSFLPVEYDKNNKFLYVLNTTGPYMLTNVYDTYADNSSIYLLPAELTSPLTKYEITQFVNKTIDQEYLDKKLENAIAIHLYFGTWLMNNESIRYNLKG